MRKIVHISDVHFGTVDPGIEDSVIRTVNDLVPDVLVVSGDLTQRARTAQFKAARAFLDKLPVPQIIVPGNHDVPLYNIFDRFLRPLDKYQRYVTDDLSPTYIDDELVIVGVNTSRSFTIKGGRINDEQIDHVRQTMCNVSDARLKIVVTHHPFDLPEGFDESDIVGRAHEAIPRITNCGANVFLSGHLHVSNLETTAKRYQLDDGRNALIVQAGTATSTRVRGEPHSFNVLEYNFPDLRVKRLECSMPGSGFAVASEKHYQKHQRGVGSGGIANKLMNDEGSGNWLAAQAHRAMIDNGFEPEFSEAVFRQLDEIKRSSPAIDNTAAKDLRDLLWSSIDNRSSRDLDQVEWAERLENGDIRVLVGIADVDRLVTQGSPIDEHARKNTVTVYTENKIFPMLPEDLSTDITSLNEGVDRVAMVADMIVKVDGDVPVSTFYPAIVRNRAKLNYESVGGWLDGGEIPDKVASIEGMRGQIELEFEAAKRLAVYRRSKGALDLESIESAAVVEDGEVKSLVSVETNAARKLIENFMVAANVEMAEFLEAHGSVSVRRVVKVPQRWDGIRRIAAEFGHDLPAEPDQPALAAFLAARRAADPEHFPDLSLSIVKLIGSGEYVIERPGEDTGGHFGLAVRDYSHSTAPNRRFSDIVVQRLVKAVIAGSPPPYSNDELEAVAAHCNLQERAARKVERKMRKVVAAVVMQRHIGETFGAIVTGVTPHGTFARILRPPVDGRIEQGERGLDVGDKVQVKVISADPRNGFIDFAAHR